MQLVYIHDEDACDAPFHLPYYGNSTEAAFGKFTLQYIDELYDRVMARAGLA